MVAIAVAAVVALLLFAAEWLHAQRVRRVATLAFGPRRRPHLWARLAPGLRVIAVALVAWGLMTLWLSKAKPHRSGTVAESDYRDLLLVLDVSPSMRLEDAGPSGKQSRRARAADVLTSFFQRVPMDVYRTTIVAFYTDAKPVVLRTTDPEVVRNVLADLPMHYAFKAGATDLIAGVKEAARIAHPWPPGKTTLVIVSDGDSIPPTGLPKLPDSIAHVLVVGVGDPTSGRFIDGHLSRQDASSLRQLATRLRGAYHNGNEKHLSTELVREASFVEPKSVWERLTLREYALFAVGFGASLLALLPLALHLLGTPWRPGVPKEARLLGEAGLLTAATAAKTA